MKGYTGRGSSKGRGGEHKGEKQNIRPPLSVEPALPALQVTTTFPESIKASVTDWGATGRSTSWTSVSVGVKT